MKANKKKNYGLTFMILVFLNIFLSVFIVLTIIFNKDKNNENLVKNEIVKEEFKEKKSSLSLVMVGDNLIHSSVYKDANRLANYQGYDFKPIIEYIKPIVSTYDLAYYNQETILGGAEIGLSDYPCFNSPYEAGDAMIDAGFNLVSLATNHTLDRGEQAILNSRTYWNNQKNVLAVGSYSSAAERNEIKVLEKNDITYTMLNYTYGTNGIAIPQGKDYLVNVWSAVTGTPETNKEYISYKEQVKKDIEAVRDKVDVLIVAMHWGVEYTHVPTSFEKDSAKFLADLGVDIIIGTHPHVIQPVEWIDDTIVFYSLGNFLSAQLNDQNYNKMVGLMSSLTINKTVKKDETIIEINNINNELIFNYYNSFKNFKVVPFSHEKIATYLPNYQNIYNTYKSVVTNLDSNMLVNNCYNCY